MKLMQHTDGHESDTEWEIPDDNFEGFLRDQLGYHLADSWEAGNVRAFRFDHEEVKPGRVMPYSIIVLQVEGVSTATLYEYPGKMGKHLGVRIAAMRRQIEELNHKLPHEAE